jgi:hypothetical protein
MTPFTFLKGINYAYRASAVWVSDAVIVKLLVLLNIYG